MKKYFVIGLLFSSLFSIDVYAKDVKVSSLADLQKAVNEASAGDRIVLKNGLYTANDDIKISCKGTSKQLITICAETIGGVEIAGTSGFNLVSPAAYVVIKGFKFTHKSSKAKSSAGTSFCRWTQNIFENSGAGESLTIAGNDHEIDHNTFQNKNAMGRFLAIRGEGSQIAERLFIHHNYFKNYKDQGGANGAEAFQFGLSGYSMSSSNSIVEYNLFEECAGEAELISVKASAVTLRYNTIRNCPAQFTLRHGNKCKVYGNYFINTPGLRIFGDDHEVFSNYFEGCKPAISIGNGDGEVADGAALTCHDRPDRVLIAFNTMINNHQNIVMSTRTNGLGATNVTIANNIIQGGPVAASIAGSLIESKWINNVLFDVKDNGAMPTTGIINLDPKLSKDNNGVFHLTKGSAAIDKSVGSYPAVTVDMDGQKRTGKLDIGADEYSKEKPIARLLEVSDVGCSF